MNFANAYQDPQEIRSRAGSQTSAQPGRAGVSDPQYRLSARGAAPADVGSAAPPVLRNIGIRLPALPGWADVWLPALRAWFSFGVYFAFSRRG